MLASDYALYNRSITTKYETVLGVAAVRIASQLISLWQHVCCFLTIMQSMLLRSVMLNLMKGLPRRADLAALKRQNVFYSTGMQID